MRLCLKYLESKMRPIQRVEIDTTRYERFKFVSVIKLKDVLKVG